ncbi:MAG: hypothetical protein ABI599_11490 [Flavobacteriales bacterium]
MTTRSASEPELLPQSVLSKLMFWLVIVSIGAFSLLWLFDPAELVGNDSDAAEPTTATHAGAVQ